MEVGAEDEIDNLPSDKIVVVDDNIEARMPFEKKVVKMFPSIRYMKGEGRLAPGQIVLEDSSATVLFGDEVRINGGKRYAIIIDRSRGRDALIMNVVNSLYKLDKRLSERAKVATEEGDERALVHKVLEYCARRLNRRFNITREKKGGHGKLEQKEASTTLVIKKKGQSYADLVKHLKEGVQKEKVGEVLTMKKGVEGALHIKLKAENLNLAEEQRRLQDKMGGATVGNKTSLRMAEIQIRDLVCDTKEQEITEAVM